MTGKAQSPTSRGGRYPANSGLRPDANSVLMVVTPTAVGGGTPFFPTLPSWISLRLLENRTFPGGAVLLRYEAKRD